VPRIPRKPLLCNGLVVYARGGIEYNTYCAKKGCFFGPAQPAGTPRPLLPRPFVHVGTPVDGIRLLWIFLPTRGGGEGRGWQGGGNGSGLAVGAMGPLDNWGWGGAWWRGAGVGRSALGCPSVLDYRPSGRQRVLVSAWLTRVGWLVLALGGGVVRLDRQRSGITPGGDRAPVLGQGSNPGCFGGAVGRSVEGLAYGGDPCLLAPFAGRQRL